MYVPKGDPPRRAVARTSVRHSILGSPALATRLQPAKSHRAAVGDWARQPPSRVTPPAVYCVHVPHPRAARGTSEREAPPLAWRGSRATETSRGSALALAHVRPRPATRGRRKATPPSRQRPASDARNKNQNSKKKHFTTWAPGVLIPSYVYPVPRRKKKERERRPATTRPGPRVACPALPWLAVRLFLRPSFLHVPITRCHLGAEHTCPRIKLPMMIILDVSSTASVFIYLFIYLLINQHDKQMRIVRVIPPCFSWSIRTYKEEGDDDDDDKEGRFKRRAWIGLCGVFSLFSNLLVR
jgi:hypothetical protein